MSIKKLFEELTPEELVDSFVFPVRLTAKQRKEADEQLREARKNAPPMSEQGLIRSGLLQLRFQIEDYLKQNTFDPLLTFSHFLKRYVTIFSKKRKDFAAEIDIDETLLSQFINMHRMPPDYVMIRLELHSNNLIPADYWYRLVEKEREHQIKTDVTLRKKEMKHVHSAFVAAVH